MQIHQLRYFVAVAETRNFGRAAQRCHVTQPSLSQQIIKLEKELGHPLFDRSTRRIQLTEAGQALLPKAQQILREIDDIQLHITEQTQTGPAKLSIGAIPTIAPYFLPETLQKLQQQHPNAQLTVHEAITQDLIQRLIQGDIDLGIMSTPIQNDLIQHQPLFQEPLLICLNKKHPLAKHKNLALQRLKDEPAIILHPMHCLSKQIESFCQQHNLTQNTTCHSTQLTTIQALIEINMGYSILPQMCARHDSSPQRTYIKIQSHTPQRTITLAWRKASTLPRLAQALAGMLTAHETNP